MKLADYSQQVTVDQLDAALRAGGFEGVFHYLRGTPGYVLRVEDPAVVAGIRARGWPQAGIDLPFNPMDANGAALAAVARFYGFQPGSRMYLDIEPARFAAAPASWPAVADAWCDAVRAGAFSPGVYGTDATVAACADHADTIWRAVPGQCDPAGPGLAPIFFAGRRAIQCGNGTWGGVNFDVSFSQFTLGGDDVSFTDDDRARLVDVQNLLLFADPTPRTINGAQVVPRVSLLADIYNLLKYGAEPDILAAIQKVGAPTVDVNALAAALAPHLPPASDPAAVAKAVALELGKALNAAP